MTTRYCLLEFIQFACIAHPNLTCKHNRAHKKPQYRSLDEMFYLLVRFELHIFLSKMSDHLFLTNPWIMYAFRKDSLIDVIVGKCY